MSEVYITGHRNPDLDSICSAYAYAVLKNRVDRENTYKAVRCGHLSQTTKDCLASIELEAVPYMRDVYPKVRDIMISNCDFIDAQEPVYKLVKTYDSEKPSAMPLSENGKYLGLLSIDDITAWFLKDNSDDVPVYDLSLQNIEKVLPGKFLKKSENIFGASILAGAADLETFKSLVRKNNNSVIVMGYRKEHIRHAVLMQVPAVVITTTDNIKDIDLSDFKGSVFVTQLATAEAIRRLRMAVSLKQIMGKQGPVLQASTLFTEAKDALTSSHLRGLSVFEEDKWVGFVTRRCFLDKPKYNVILVDHNETAQSIKGIETATVKEIIDHHRLDALKTDLPIFIDAEPLGSTCTIVYQQFLRHSIIPDATTAKTLLTGIIADTLILKSPTTTDTDRSSAGALAALCGIFDIKEFGEKLFSGSLALGSRKPEEVIASDFKQYTEKGFKFGIGQCEVTTLKDVGEYAEMYLASLEHSRLSMGLDWAMLMVTDVLREKSILFATENRLNSKLPYAIVQSGVYDMPKVMSRKKQLLPEIIHTMEQ